MSSFLSRLKFVSKPENSRYRLGFLLLGLAGLILQTLVHSWILMTVLVVAASYGLGLSVRLWFLKTKVSSAVVGFITLSSIISFIATMAWIADIKVPLEAIFFASYSVALALIVFTKSEDERRKLFDIKDIASGLVVLAYIGLLVFGGVITKIKSQDMNLSTAATQFVSYSVDDISHINMYKDHIEANKGLILGDRDQAYISKSDHLIYPKVAHLIPATFYSSTVLAKEMTASRTISSYAIFKVTFFALAIFLLVRSSFVLVGRVEDKKRIALLLVGGALGLAVILGFVNVFVQEGFFSVWPIFLCLPVLALISRRNIATLSHMQALFVGSSVAMIFMSWPIMALPISLSIMANLLVYMYKHKKIPYLKTVLLGSAALGLTQLYAQSLDPAAASNSAQFSTPGGIPPFNLLYFFLLIPLSIIGLRYFYKRDRKDGANSSFLVQASFIVFSVGLCLGIGLINLLETGSPQYFYYKSSYITLAILAIFYLPCITDFSLRFVKQSKSILNSAVLAIIVTLVMGLIMGLGSGKGYIRYVYLYSLKGERHVSSSAAKVIYASDDDTNEVSFILDMDSRINNYYNQAYLSALNRYDICHRLVGEVGFVDMLKRADNPMWGNCDSIVSGDSKVNLVVEDDVSLGNEVSCEEYRTILNAIRTMPAGKKEYTGTTTC